MYLGCIISTLINAWCETRYVYTIIEIETTGLIN